MESLAGASHVGLKNTEWNQLLMAELGLSSTQAKNSRSTWSSAAGFPCLKSLKGCQNLKVRVRPNGQKRPPMGYTPVNHQSEQTPTAPTKAATLHAATSSEPPLDPSPAAKSAAQHTHAKWDCRSTPAGCRVPPGTMPTKSPNAAPRNKPPGTPHPTPQQSLRGAPAEPQKSTTPHPSTWPQTRSIAKNSWICGLSAFSNPATGPK